MELQMLPDPLHPAVVHFPIVLMTFLPLAAIGALLALQRGVSPRRAWIAPVALAGLLTLSAWVAVQTGESGEEQAEDVVGERVLHTHEEAAERFLAMSGGVLVLTAAGLLGGIPGRAARVVGALATVGLFVAGYQVGHTGGRVAYGDGSTAGVSQVTAGAGDQGQGQRESRAGHGDDD